MQISENFGSRWGPHVTRPTLVMRQDFSVEGVRQMFWGAFFGGWGIIVL